MTFEQFQATRRHVANVNDVVGVAADEAASGYVYEGDLHIFDMGADKPSEFLLVIGSAQKVSADLADLERDLYQFGCEEGILTHSTH